MKIFIFAPHPDDEIYGCGGIILRWMEEGKLIERFGIFKLKDAGKFYNF